VGVSVATTTTDCDIVQALLTFLENRRVLFNPEYFEVETFTEALQQLDPKSATVSSISTMRTACRRFPDHPQQHFRHFEGPRHRSDDLAPGLFVVLGELRATFGAELQRLHMQVQAPHRGPAS
jgi:hypothetical protein